MFKRLMLLCAAAACLAGCQSNTTTPSVMDMIEEVEAQEQADTAPVAEPVAEAEAVTTEVETPEAVQPTEVEEPEEEIVQQAQEPKKRNTVMILMKTSKGDIKLELNREKAPKTVDNFLSYVEAGHYNGTIFHRVIDGFMIQGGGFDADMHQKPAPRTVENEASNGLKNVVGSIAMARTPDPHSASAQFFINVKDNAFLDYPGQDGWGYCVFGQVVEGMDVVNAIKSVPTRNSGMNQNVPTEPIMINEVSVIEE